MVSAGRICYTGGVDRIALGRIGESAAVALLQRRGYRILARNFRCPLGELDLVAADGGVIVFVEVKTRTTAGRGDPFDAITPRKQRRLTRLATYFLKGRNALHRPARFDAVSVTVTPQGRVERTTLLQDAFDAAG